MKVVPLEIFLSLLSFPTAGAERKCTPGGIIYSRDVCFLLLLLLDAAQHTSHPTGIAPHFRPRRQMGWHVRASSQMCLCTQQHAVGLGR